MRFLQCTFSAGVMEETTELHSIRYTAVRHIFAENSSRAAVSALSLQSMQTPRVSMTTLDRSLTQVGCQRQRENMSRIYILVDKLGLVNSIHSRLMIDSCFISSEKRQKDTD